MVYQRFGIYSISFSIMFCIFTILLFLFRASSETDALISVLKDGARALENYQELDTFEVSDLSLLFRVYYSKHWTSGVKVLI